MTVPEPSVKFLPGKSLGLHYNVFDDQALAFMRLPAPLRPIFSHFSPPVAKVGLGFEFGVPGSGFASAKVDGESVGTVLAPVPQPGRAR
jgi:hypothetical protein